MTIVCLASGPSLTQADVNAVRGQARVIAVNDTIKLAPWADWLYSSDRYWWKLYQGVPSFTGPKYSVTVNEGSEKPYRDLPGVTALRNTGIDGLELDPTGLRTGKNSGYAAINLAVHFGAKRIILLGYDMGAQPGKAHFFGDHPAPLNNPGPTHFDMWRRYFDTLPAPLAAAGVEVLNCSRRSALTCFPRVALADAFAAVPA